MYKYREIISYVLLWPLSIGTLDFQDLTAAKPDFTKAGFQNPTAVLLRPEY
jgi:hypothetical protein